MVDLRRARIEWDEFEIVQGYRLFRLLQPQRVRTLVLFKKIRDRKNFSLNVGLVGKMISGDKSRKMQEKLAAQGQGIDCSLALVRKYVLFAGAYERLQVAYGASSLDF